MLSSFESRKKFYVKNNYILPTNNLAKQKLKEKRKSVKAN